MTTHHSSNPMIIIGEILCDLFPEQPGASLSQTTNFCLHLGGAPANVAVQVARNGHQPLMVSLIGSDPLGSQMVAQLESEGVEITWIQTHASKKTGLTFVEIDASGERTFFPWRTLSADEDFSADLLPMALLSKASILYHGTVTMRHASGHQATCQAVEATRAGGGLVAVDINLRFGTYRGQHEEMIRKAKESIQGAHIVKATIDEVQVLYGEGNMEHWVESLRQQNVDLILLTDGANGATLATQTERIHIAAPATQAIDATGAGDAFMGSILSSVYEHDCQQRDLQHLNVEQIAEWGRLANGAGARVTTCMGATTAMINHRKL